MKYKKFFLFFLLGGLLLGACKDVEDINKDPNNASDAPLESVLTSVFASSIIAHEGHPARLAGVWSKQFTGSARSNSAYYAYTINSSEFQWDVNYILISNANVVIEKATAENNLLASGIAKVMKAHTLGMTTALWGDIPFSERAQFPEIVNAKFDDQVSVYASVQTLLDEAISDLNSNPTSDVVAAKDLFFGGDATAWEKVAQTLKARFYLHTSDYSQAAAAASKGLLDATGDWMLPHPTGTYLEDQNLYYSFGAVDWEGYIRARGATLPDWLDSSSTNYRGNDKTDETERFAFIYIGTGSNNHDLNYDGMWAPNAPFPLATAIENFLILAECAWRTDDLPAALDHLNAARSILAIQFPLGKYEAYEMADFAPDGMAGAVGKTVEEALLYEILEEKYASLVGQIEVFNDLRRTDNFLGLTPVQGNAFPERFLVPQVEIDENVNVPNPIPGLFDPTPVNQ